MDVRPGDGLVKVRFADRLVTEVDVDLVTGSVLGSSARNDVFLEQLHSGEIFGSRDEGDAWELVAGYLPPVLSVAVAIV